MNFSVPANEDQTRIKVVKKADLAARREARRSFLDAEEAASKAQEVAHPPEAAKGSGAPGHVHAPGGTSASAPSGPLTATVVPAPQITEPKVQLVEVEPGIYDVYFTCSCREQYVIRCESLEKAAKK